MSHQFSPSYSLSPTSSTATSTTPPSSGNYLNSSPVSTHATTMSSSSSVCSSLSPAAAELSASFNMAGNDFSSSADSTTEEATVCKWDHCGRLYDDPEALYQHLCNDHVGRKSTNNLCLTCRWEGCDVTCAKRDHITSHIRVHTPLKPHSCSTCGKTFKRPQDLKKHERIHTEDHQQKQAQTKLHKQQQAAHAKELLKRQQESTAAAQQQQQVNGPFAAHPYHHTGHQGLYNVPFSQAQRNGNVVPHNAYLALASQHAQAMSSSYGRQFAASDTGDSNSYVFPTHGGGMKRGYEELLHGVGALFEDAKKKRVASMPNHHYSALPSHSMSYDASVAQKLHSVFGSSFDEAMLQGLLNGQAIPHRAQAASHPHWAHHQQQQQPHYSSSLPTDLHAGAHGKIAELNSFLLQLGNSAARDVSHQHQHVHHTTPASSSSATPASSVTPAPAPSQPVGFDMASLAAAGLTNIPGFDESIFNFESGTGTRPIAGMPRGHSEPGISSETSYGFANGYTDATHGVSFDSMRSQRGQQSVPGLAARLDPNNFRHVEPLMRAAPSSPSLPSISSLLNPKASSQHRGTSAESTPSTSPASSPRSEAEEQSEKLYPSLPATSAIDDKIKSLALDSEQDVPLDMRLKHIALIKTLLIAINFPERLVEGGQGEQRKESIDV